jgi:hypothetical protein
MEVRMKRIPAAKVSDSAKVSRRKFVVGTVAAGVGFVAGTTGTSAQPRGFSINGKGMTVTAPNGISLSINDLQLSDPEKAALNKLLDLKDPAKLTPAERKLLVGKKSLIGEGPQALIIRFDVKIVRIDEKVPANLLRAVPK